MNEDGTVNSQVTDSVTQSFAGLISAAPAHNMGLLDTVMAEAMGMAMHNAVHTQHQAQMTGNATVSATCALILQSFYTSHNAFPGGQHSADQPMPKSPNDSSGTHPVSTTEPGLESAPHKISSTSNLTVGKSAKEAEVEPQPARRRIVGMGTLSR